MPKYKVPFMIEVCLHKIEDAATPEAAKAKAVKRLEQDDAMYIEGKFVGVHKVMDAMELPELNLDES